MSDIIDRIRARLAATAVDLTPAVEAVLLDVRMEYAGDTVYIRQPKIRELMPTRQTAKTRALERPSSA